MSYYKMERGWLDSDMFAKAEYDERSAWAWMIGEARWEDGLTPINGLPMPVKRGQFYASIRFMSDKFQWSKDRVTRFLNRMKKWGAIHIETATGQNLITICNYSEYQDTKDDPKDTSKDGVKDTPKDDPKDKLEEILRNSKKERKEEFVLPDWIPEQSWESFISHRKAIKKIMTEGAKAILVSKLGKLRSEGHDPQKLLEKSILGGWAGVFPSDDTMAKPPDKPRYKMPSPAGG